MRNRLLFIALLLIVPGSQAIAESSKTERKVENKQAERELAAAYRDRRSGATERHCPCAASAQEYCSCDSRGSYGGRYYGYGYWHDPYATAAGWSRGSWRGSDTPTTGYTPNARR